MSCLLRQYRWFFVLGPASSCIFALKPPTVNLAIIFVTAQPNLTTTSFLLRTFHSPLVQLHIMSLPTYDNITQGGITIYDWTWLLLNFHTHTPISPHPHPHPYSHTPTHSLSIPPWCFVSILHRSRFHFGHSPSLPHVLCQFYIDLDFITLHPFYHTASRQSNFGLLVLITKSTELFLLNSLSRFKFSWDAIFSQSRLHKLGFFLGGGKSI